MRGRQLAFRSGWGKLRRVKFLGANPWLGSRYAAAIAGGFLLACAFPQINIAGLAWIAPGILAAAALGKKGGERWRIGYVGGLAHYLSMLYWLLLIPYRWKGLPLGPALGWVALSAFVALFTATWVWIVTTPVVKFRTDGASAGPSGEGPDASSYGSGLPRSWLGRMMWGLFGASAWVALEMLLARIFGGFPWDLLGVSQFRMVPLIQMASVTGVYGLSFLIIWVSLSFVLAALMVIRRPTVRSVWVRELFVPLLVVAIVFNQGLRELKTAPPAERGVKVLLVQPSIPQELIWNPTLDTNRFNTLVSYTDQLLTNATDLVIWPESGVPKLLRYDQATFDAISGLAKKRKVWMIVGSDDAEPRAGAGNAEAEYYNSSFLVSPEGRLAERYNKRNLVIFGEYVPLRRWLPFLGWFTPVQGGFTAGKGPVPFHLPELHITASVLICFEDIFPQLASAELSSETDLLVNITNDGWFGHSAAQWQHAASALFRAVETRTPLVRCCNNGVSCWIDDHGRIREILRDKSGTVYGTGYLAADIRLPDRSDSFKGTFYSRHGDVFGWICVALSTGLLLVRTFFGLKHRRK